MSPISPHNILRHELIGLQVSVSCSTNRSLKGVRGAVVDETRNMLTIFSARGAKMIPKDIATFRFTLPSGAKVDVEGKRLLAKPENRLKTRVRRW